MSSPLQPPRLPEEQTSEAAPVYAEGFKILPFDPSHFTGRFQLPDWRLGERVELIQRSTLSSATSVLSFIAGMVLAPFPILWMIAYYAFIAMLALLFGGMLIVWAFSLPKESFESYLQPEIIFGLVALSAVVVLYRVGRDIYLRAKNLPMRRAIFDWTTKEAIFAVGGRSRTVGFSQIQKITVHNYKTKRLNLAGMLEHAPETSRDEFYCDVVVSLPNEDIVFLRTLGTDLSTGTVSSMVGLLTRSLELP